MAAHKGGATAIEYCLVASLFSLVALSSVQLIGLDVARFITQVIFGLK